MYSKVVNEAFSIQDITLCCKFTDILILMVLYTRQLLDVMKWNVSRPPRLALHADDVHRICLFLLLQMIGCNACSIDTHVDSARAPLFVA